MNMILRHSQRLAAVAALLAIACLAPAFAQVAPSGAEFAQFSGLHTAAYHGDVAMVRSLIAASARLDARTLNGRTPLHVATFARQREVISLLAKAGADLSAIDRDRYDAVTIAAAANDEDTLRLLLSLGASANLVTSRDDGTALIAAARLGHAGVVRQLIAAGAPLDHVNNLGRTAVIEAVVLGDGGPRHQQTLQALVDAGANLALSDREGRTPLMLAQARGYTQMVRILQARAAR